MNNICNSLQLTFLFPFLFCDMRLPDGKNKHGMGKTKKYLSRLFVLRPWRMDRIKEEAWARSSLQNMPTLLIVYESKEFGSVEKMCNLANLNIKRSFHLKRVKQIMILSLGTKIISTCTFNILSRCTILDMCKEG